MTESIRPSNLSLVAAEDDCGTDVVEVSRPGRGDVWCGRALIVPISGDLDLETAPDFASWLCPLVARGCHLVLDLSAVRFLGCAGLTLFVQLHRGAETAGGSLTLISVAPPLLRIIELTDLQTLLRIRAHDRASPDGSGRCC